MKTTHPLQSLAMDITGKSLKIAGTAFDIGKIIFDPGDRCKERPGLLVMLHCRDEPEAPAEPGVRHYGTAPSDVAARLLTEGSFGDIELMRTVKEGPSHFHVILRESRSKTGSIGCGKTLLLAAEEALGLLAKHGS